MINLTTADKALKDIYLTAITNQLNTSANPLFARIKRSTNNVYGNSIRKLVPYGVNGGVGAGTENGDLPSAVGNKYACFETSLKNLYGTIEITDKAIRASENSEGAFVNLLTSEMESLIEASSMNFARMLYGDGTGALATVVSNTKNAVSVDTDIYLFEGMLVDIYDGSTASVTGRTIESIGKDSSGNPVINLSGAEIGTLKNTDKVYVQNSKGLEITGLKAIFGDSATLYGVPRASNAWVRPYTENVDGTISLSAIRKAVDSVERDTGSRSNFIVCSLGVKRSLENYLTDNAIPYVTRIVDGFKAIMLDGIPVVGDRFCPEGTMFILNTDDFTLHQLCDWRWLEGEDGKILRQKSGQPVYTATLVKYCELICNRPRGQAMLTGITES